MANIRRDEAQLIITIDAKESAEYQKVLSGTAKGVQDIKKLTVGTEEYNAALNEQAAISRKLSQTDYTKLSIKQIQDRRAQLVQLQRTLPGVTFAEAGFERELQQVNTALATNAQRTRAVSGAMRSGANDIRNFIGAYVGIGAAISLGQQIFEQIKQIDSLNKAYQLLIPVTSERARADEFLAGMAANYGLEISKLRDEYIKYTASAKASTLSLSDQELVFESVAKASSALGLSTETQSRAFTALQQIMSKGKVSAEELKGQLGDALPGAVTIMAKALGVGVGELQKMLEAGEVMADEALPKFALELQKAYGVDQITTIENVSAAQGRFKNTVTELITVVGGGLNTVLVAMFDTLRLGLTFVIAFAKGLSEIPKFIKENEVAIKAMVLGLVIFNGQMILAAANSLRLAAVERGRAIVTGAVTVAQNLLNAAMTANPIGLVIRAVGLLIVGFGALYAKSETVRAGISGLGNVASEIFKIIKEAVGAFIDGFNELKEGNFKEAFKSFSEGIVKTNPIGVALTQGKRLKDAFNKGFNDKLEAEKAKREAEKQAQDLVNSLDKVNAAKNKLDDTNSDLGKTKATKGGADDDKKEKKSKKEDQFSDIPKAITIDTTSQLLIDERIKQLEEAAKREQAIIEESYREGKISLEQYEIERMRITSANLATRIELLDAFGQQESDKRRELNIQLLQVENELVQERAAQIGDLENAQLSDLERKFANRLITEEEYNLSRLRVQLNFYDEQMRLLEENGLIETDVYKKIQDAKLQTQIDYNKQREDNEQRTQDLQMAIQRDGLGAAAELFSLGADLLGQDEKARKKHANAIKAFEVAQIAVNLASEVQGIWKNANSNPINKLIPGWGPIFAGIQTGFAIGRAGIQTAKVSAQQFYLGGKIKTLKALSGQRITEQPNIPTLPGGDNVLIAAKPGEVMMNDNQQGALKQIAGNDIFERLRIPGFYNGGVVPSLPSTTPTLRPQVLSRNPAPVSADNSRIDMLLDAVQQITTAVPQAISAMNLKTHVVYTDIEKTKNTVDEIKRIASI